MSPTALNQRLHDLRDAGIIDSAEEGGYALSALGAGLLESMGPLLHWSEKWQGALSKEYKETK